MTSSVRFILAVVLIAATAIFLQARGRNEVFPSRLPLKSFPLQLDEWTGTDVPMEKDVLDVLGPGDFLLRIYQNQAKQDPYVDLFIAYFRSQRAGDTIHSPKNCLPGAGWTPVESSHITLSLPGHGPFPAKFYLVTDSVRMNRSDGALVRITTAMYPGESTDAAQQRVLPFAGNVVPLLNDYIPR